ncbi:rhodanese-like domain-containing protein [Virgibacillus halophilus]|uniref:Rhodanese-like domain-containing protein n=1 Tax=Tigheibacillus halophilus TaxID=361280 RepID=A0ABU5C7G0_9BACI|nr:rhodanese-like domain-containing protein [Virgibacillus halophilus]
MGKIGIDQDTTVVIYDAGNDMFAPRAWWLLHHLGHEKTYVLDGGLARWVEEGNELTTQITQSMPKDFKPQFRCDETVDIDRLKEKLEKNKAILIDSRSKERYLGNEEPLYKKSWPYSRSKALFLEGCS